MKHYSKSQPIPCIDPEALFEEAMANFPYQDYQTTGYCDGSLEPDENCVVEYSEEYTFTVGKLFDERLEAGGWIDVRRDSAGEELSITALFTVARNGDFKDGLIFPECYGVTAWYDIHAGNWEFEAGYY